MSIIRASWRTTSYWQLCFLLTVSAFCYGSLLTSAAGSHLGPNDVSGEVLLERPAWHGSHPLLQQCLADPVCKRLLDQQHVLQREKHDSALSQQQQKEQELQLSASHDAWQGAQAAELQLITTHGPRSTASAANQKNNQDDNQQRLGERTNTANSFALHGSDAVAAGTLDDAFAAGGDDDDDSGGRGGERATPLLRLVAGAALLVEAVAGMYLPAALQVLRSPQWYLSLLNCFSGGVFLAAGLVHLLPHCAEAQEALGPVGPHGDYPLYLVLVVVGYCAVFYVERVLFDVHGEGHSHCQHSNVFTHSSYYESLSHQPRGGGGGTGPGSGKVTPTGHGRHSRSRSREDPSLLECNPKSAAIVAAPTAATCSHSHARNHNHPHPHAHGSYPGGRVSPSPLGNVSSVRFSAVPPLPPLPPPAGAAKPITCGKRKDVGAAATSSGGGGVIAAGASPAAQPLSCVTDEATSAVLSEAARGPATTAAVLVDEQQSENGSAVAVYGSVLPPELAADSDGGVQQADGGADAAYGSGGEWTPPAATAAQLSVGDNVLADDTSSCHSEHEPLAVCVCVDHPDSGPAAAATTTCTPPTAAAAAATEAPASPYRDLYLPQRHPHAVRAHHGHGHRHSQEDLTEPLLPAPDAASNSGLPSPSPHSHSSHHHTHEPPHGRLSAHHGHSHAPDPPGSRNRSAPHAPRTLPHGPVRPGHHAQHAHAVAAACAAAAASGGLLLDSGTANGSGNASGGATGRGGHHHHHHHGCSHGSHGCNHHSHQHNHLSDHSDANGGPHRHQVQHSIRPRFRFMHGVVLLVAMGLHTGLECMALGLIDGRTEFLVLFAAIASHKVVSSLALSSRFMREGATLGQVTLYVGPFCLVAPLSILLGSVIGSVAPWAHLVLSCFATGTFLYVGASEVIMEEFEGEMRADRRDMSTRAARYIKFGAVLAAVGLVAAAAALPEPDHH